MAGAPYLSKSAGRRRKKGFAIPLSSVPANHGNQHSPHGGSAWWRHRARLAICMSGLRHDKSRTAMSALGNSASIAGPFACPLPYRCRYPGSDRPTELEMGGVARQVALSLLAFLTTCDSARNTFPQRRRSCLPCGSRCSRLQPCFSRRRSKRVCPVAIARLMKYVIFIIVLLCFFDTLFTVARRSKPSISAPCLRAPNAAWTALARRKNLLRP